MKDQEKLAEEIQANIQPGEEMSVEEIHEVAYEVRQERYERLKKEVSRANSEKE